MSDPGTILQRAREFGLRVYLDGNQIAITPARRCPPELVADFGRHKAAILELLREKRASLPSDEAPWMAIAAQVLAGKFSGADRSLVGSLVIGLRRVNHPLAKRASILLTEESPQ